jgi:hypothetical protein
MKKMISWETAKFSLDAIAFVLTREYFEATGEEPDAAFIEERTKFRFFDFCRVEGIEEVEVNEE